MNKRAILKDRLNVKVPYGYSLHECVKGNAVDKSNRSRRCLVCAHYSQIIGSDLCFECLGTERLDNFKENKCLADTEWYKDFCEKPNRYITEYKYEDKERAHIERTVKEVLYLALINKGDE